MKYIFLVLLGLTVFSCQSQTPTNLLSLKFDSDLLSIVQKDKILKKDQDPNLGLMAYSSIQPGNYAIGKIKLSTYAFPGGHAADYNNISLFVTTIDKPHYLGFNYSSVNQQETKSILSYLKKTYPRYQKLATGGNGESYFWDIPSMNAWLFTAQGISIDRNKKEFFTSNFLFVKKGTRMENTSGIKASNIKAYYQMMYPDLK